MCTDRIQKYLRKTRDRTKSGHLPKLPLRIHRPRCKSTPSDSQSAAELSLQSAHKRGNRMG